MAQKRSALIIEDDLNTAELVKISLQTLSFTVYTATNATRGFELAHEKQPDLIIMDLLLPPPGLKGWEAIAVLKADPILKDTPVLVLTAGDIATIKLAVEAGSDSYLRKPFTISQIKEKIRELLGH